MASSSEIHQPATPDGWPRSMAGLCQTSSAFTRENWSKNHSQITPVSSLPSAIGPTAFHTSCGIYVVASPAGVWVCPAPLCLTYSLQHTGPKPMDHGVLLTPFCSKRPWLSSIFTVTCIPHGFHHMVFSLVQLHIWQTGVITCYCLTDF